MFVFSFIVVYKFVYSRFRQQLQENMKSLDDMREMSASRASLSFLDSSRDERLNSETTSNSSGLQEKQQMYKSYDSLDVSKPNRG